MKIKLGERFKHTKNYGKIMDAEENNYIVTVRFEGQDLRYPKQAFEERLKNGMFVEVKKNGEN